MNFVFLPTHHQVIKSSQNIKISKLGYAPTMPRSIPLPPNFSYITLEAFVRFESSHMSKNMIIVFHPAHHQVTKSSQHTKITKLGYAPTIPRSIPFAAKLFPHHFVGI